MDQISRADGKEPAQGTVQYDNGSAEQHGKCIVHTEQCTEQLAAGSEAGSGVGNEENNNDDCSNTCKNMPVIAISFGEEVRKRESADLTGIETDPSGYQKPVGIGA